MNIDNSLSEIRKVFEDLNPDLFEKIKAHREKQTVGYNLGSHHYDYVGFSDVLTKGFAFSEMHRLFESLMYLHFFSEVYSFDLNVRKYISFDIFDIEKLTKDVKNDASLIINLNITESWCKDILSSMNISNCESIFSDGKNLFSVLKSIQYANKKELFHFGDREFIVSKIPLTNKQTTFTKSFNLNKNIFYSSDPSQIVNFAFNSQPGTYIIANVPYGRMAETAFYVLFRQDNCAYLIENCKHSYRDQHYRTKSDGTDGKTAWLERKYEQTYFPVDVVLDFFKKQNDDKDVSTMKELQFRPIAKIADCSAEVILWLYSFIDNCSLQLSNEDFQKEISLSISAEFIKDNRNIPIKSKRKKKNDILVFQDQLPTKSQFSTQWNPEQVSVGNIDSLINYNLKPIKISDITIQTGRLTSAEQIKREIIFEARKITAEKLREELENDFIQNYEKVHQWLASLIEERKQFVIDKALENKEYPFVNYHTFCDPLETPCQKETSTILTGYCIKSPKEMFKSFIRPNNQRCNSSSYDSRTIWIKKPPFRGKGLCNQCEKNYVQYSYKLEFIDFEQFKSFFELDDKYEVPKQLKFYLNKSQSLYHGNSILDDIDPVALIRNPWWRCRFNNDTIGDYRDTCLIIMFQICGKCNKKLNTVQREIKKIVDNYDTD